VVVVEPGSTPITAETLVEAARQALPSSDLDVGADLEDAIEGQAEEP
jgi:hypothetical protein